MVVVLLVAGLVVGLAAGVAVALLVGGRQRQALATAQEQAIRIATEQLRAQASAERDAAVREAVDRLDLLARERVGAVSAHGEQALAGRHALIDQRLEEVRHDLTSQLGQVNEAISRLTTRSAESFGDVAARLRAHAETTEALAATTRHLREALANPKARGQWGERMAEDVLRLAGFQEHVNYRKQTAVTDGRTIPDFTFPLPKGQVLYMDVKFPLTAYLRFLEAGTDAERASYRDAFLRDVRLRVRALAARDYADAGRRSLPYVLLFLPNESIMGFVHEQSPELVDEALRQQVVLCSPLTLFAMLGVIRQAFDNFMVEQTADEILGLIGAFRQQYGKFAGQLDKLGRSLESSRRAYDDLAGPRRRQLEKPLARLEALRTERGLPVASGVDADEDAEADDPEGGAVVALGPGRAS